MHEDEKKRGARISIADQGSRAKEKKKITLGESARK